MRRHDVIKLVASGTRFNTLGRGMLPLAAIFYSRAVMAETPLERGAYLVRGIAGCGNCHTPRDPDEQPIGTVELTWAKGSIELAATGHRRRPFTALAGMHHGVARRPKSALPYEKSPWHGFNPVPDLRR